MGGRGGKPQEVEEAIVGEMPACALSLYFET